MTLRMELLTFRQTGCPQALLFGDKAASYNFFSNCPCFITQGQVDQPWVHDCVSGKPLCICDESLVLLNEAQLEPQPRGPNTEDWLSSDIMGPGVALKKS